MDNKNTDNRLGNLPQRDANTAPAGIRGEVPVDSVQQSQTTGSFNRVRRPDSRVEGDMKGINAERVRLADTATRTKVTGGAVANAPASMSDTRPITLTGTTQGQKSAEIDNDSSQTQNTTVVPQNARNTGATAKNDDTRAIDPAVKNSKNPASKPIKTKKIKKRRADKERSESSNTVLSLVKCMAYITVVFAVSIVISVAVIFVANDKYGFVKSEEEVEVIIPKGTTIDDVAEILYNHKIIKYKWLFNSDFAGSGIKIEPGTYTLVPKTSYDELVETIRKKPPVGISWITIPEGYTTDEIIDLFVASGIGEREAYIDVINNYEFDYWFVDAIDEDWEASGRTYRLDGYLFPDSYQFYNASSEVSVINKLLARFNQVFIESYKQRTEEIGYTVDDVLTLSSLIEKEAGSANYFGNVSSVFHNRLAAPSYYPHLESDATTAYVIQHETGVRVKIKGSDIDNIFSEYNTYDTVGLTPGAIANSGNSAILASMHPSDTQFYFFYSPPSPKPGEESVLFSRTKEEHNALVNKYIG